MNAIEIINNTGFDTNEIDELKKFVDFSVKHLKLENIMFNVIVVDDEEIHSINKEYRNIDECTDVIAFALEDDETFVELNFRVLGDIYISIETAQKQAKEYNHSLNRELLFLAIHGLLHLLGYDHMLEDEEKEMIELQELILNEYRTKKHS